MTAITPAGSPDKDGVTKGAYGILALLALTYMFSFLDRQIIAILAEPIKIDLGLSDTQVGLLTGVLFAVFYTTFGIPIAWLADRGNRIRIIAASCALWSLFTCVCGAATSFWQLGLARIGVGIGEAGGTPPAYSVISDLFPPARRAMALALYSLGVPAGLMMGTLLGGVVADAWGWRWAFVVVGAPGVLLALIILLVVREPVRRLAAPGQQESHDKPSLWASVSWFFRNPLLVLLAVASGLAGFAGYGFLNWMPVLLIRVKEMSLMEVGAYFSWVIGVSSALGLWLGGYFVSRFARSNPKAYAIVPAIAFLAAAPFALGAVWAPGWPASLLLICIPALLTSTYLAPALALLQNVTPGPMRATASAILLMLLNLIGLGGGPLYVGMVSDHLAPALGGDALIWAMTAVVPFFALAALCFLFAMRFIDRDGNLSA